MEQILLTPKEILGKLRMGKPEFFTAQEIAKAQLKKVVEKGLKPRAQRHINRILINFSEEEYQDLLKKAGLEG